MAVLALILTVAWIAIVAGVRRLIQLRQSGRIGLYRGDRPDRRGIGHLRPSRHVPFAQ